MSSPFRYEKSPVKGPCSLTGAAKKNRTSDLLITNQLLYRLSYSGMRYILLHHRDFFKKKFQSDAENHACRKDGGKERTKKAKGMAFRL